MKVYLISGIAADERMFKYIRLPAGFEPVFIPWIKPDPQESLPSYAGRLSSKINSGEPFALIGISLGGIMASEIALRLKPAVTIIIGSVPDISQLPTYYTWARKISFHKLIPGTLYQWAAIAKHFFSLTNSGNKKTNMEMIRDADPSFIRWGINAVLHWTNSKTPQPLIHIHGTRDEVFPFRYTRPTHTISKGTHIISLTHADEINQILQQKPGPLNPL